MTATFDYYFETRYAIADDAEKLGRMVARMNDYLKKEDYRRASFVADRIASVAQGVCNYADFVADCYDGDVTLVH